VSTDPRWARVEALFDGALDRPATERRAWLAAECGGDESLRAEVARMLDAHERAGGILDSAPPPAPDPDPAETARRLAAAFAGRFELERELGRGGSATVFLARELKHGRRIVLKVLDPTIARLWGAERFAREVRIAANLAHPHIVGLLDSGAEGDLWWYAMPYVEGETLRARLRRPPPLTPAEATGLPATWPTRSPSPTGRAWPTATSSRRTCSSRGATPTCSTSASRSSSPHTPATAT
jgi:serine/threonine-protein kinase